MEGTTSQEKLIATAHANGMGHLALTETNGLWGIIRFIQRAHTANMKPIAGVNLITDDDEAILLAENQKGYENMARAISAVHDLSLIHI